MATCAVLVAKKVQRHGEKAIGQHQVGRIGRALRCFREALSEVECLEKFAIVELIDAQAPEGAQAIMLVIEPVRQFEGDCECWARIPRTTLAVHQRPAERRRELHAQACRTYSAIVQLRERQFGALATFAEQRQVDP